MDLAIYISMKNIELSLNQRTIIKSMLEQELKAIRTEWTRARIDASLSYIKEVEDLLKVLEG
jgi:hypothetical protein